jgi:hypothetical protein
MREPAVAPHAGHGPAGFEDQEGRAVAQAAIRREIRRDGPRGYISAPIT